MTNNEKEAFMEITEMVKQTTAGFARIAKICESQIKEIEIRLGKTKELLEQQQKGSDK